MGDPVLRKRAKKVETVTERHRALLESMARFMRDSRGIGLAAPQVGVGEAMIVVDIGSGLHKLVNPRIAEKEGEQSLEEGCLSVPGVYVKVKRSRRVVVEGLDERGKPVRIDAKDLLACVFQHEIDHLHGRLICDYVPVREKIEIECHIKDYLERRDDDSPDAKRKSKAA
jgi:peptide deformylase